MTEQTLFSSEQTDVLDQIVGELHKTPGWPVDPVKDRMYVADLLESFPALDLVDQIRAWRAWMLDHQQKEKVKPRARFRNWCVRSVQFATERGPGGAASRGQGPRHRRTSTAARPASAFGEQSSQSLTRW